MDGSMMKSGSLEAEWWKSEADWWKQVLGSSMTKQSERRIQAQIDDLNQCLDRVKALLTEIQELLTKL